MAKTSLVVKAGRKQRYKTREYNRCSRCGRPRAYYRKFGICRICSRRQRSTTWGGARPSSGGTSGLPVRSQRTDDQHLTARACTSRRFA